MKLDDKTFLDIANVIANKSKCQSLQVGAVIVKDNRVISMGINGTPNGFKNCNDIEFTDTYKRDNINIDNCKYKSNEVHTAWSMMHEIHAEMNAILYAAKNGIPIDGTTIYVTHEPCDQCLKNIIQSGIKRVVYLHKYSGIVTNSEYREICSKYVKLEQYE